MNRAPEQPEDKTAEGPQAPEPARGAEVVDLAAYRRARNTRPRPSPDAA